MGGAASGGRAYASGYPCGASAPVVRDVVERFDAGLFGCSYAVETRENLVKAIKIMTNVNAKYFSGFSRAIRKRQTLKHFALLPIDDYQDADSSPYHVPIVITNYMIPLTLKDIIDQSIKGRPPAHWDYTQKFITLYGIASAMEYVNSRRMCNCNLKPSNILFDAEFQPRISDFYFAPLFPLSHTIRSRARVLSHSALYLAPELISYRSAPIRTHRSMDVYSFAMICYATLLDRVPFQDDKREQESDFDAFLTRIEKGHRPFLDSSQRIEDAWKELISRCWAADHTSRPEWPEIVRTLERPHFHRQVNDKRFREYQRLIREAAKAAPDGESVSAAQSSQVAQPESALPDEQATGGAAADDQELSLAVEAPPNGESVSAAQSSQVAEPAPNGEASLDAESALAGEASPNDRSAAVVQTSQVAEVEGGHETSRDAESALAAGSSSNDELDSTTHTAESSRGIEHCHAGERPEAETFSSGRICSRSQIFAERRILSESGISWRIRART